MKHILVHGLGQNANNWKTVVSLMKNPENVLCPDLYELLDSQKFSYDILYKVFAEYCNSIPGKICICGLSLGGILSINYVIDIPDKVESLILIGTQYKMPKTMLKLQNIIMRILPEKYTGNSIISKENMIGLTKSMYAINFENKLEKIKCKTLILCGENDNANRKASIELSNKIEDAKIEIIEGAGHEVNKDRPELLAERIEYFYNNKV
jgi:pimeloyl-ACP methyl ester carboxylesterase